MSKYLDEAGVAYFYETIKHQMFVKSAVAPICFMGRLLDRFGYEDGTRALYGQSVAYDGTYYYSCGSYNSNANQCISKHDSTGAVVDSANYTELYHAQSLTILGDKIYVVPCNGPYIATVDLETLDYESTITLTESTIANVLGLSAYDGTLYARCRDSAYNQYIYSINTSTGACTLVCAIGALLNRVNQGFCYAGDVAYCVNNYRSAIFEIDTKTGAIIRTYNLPSGDSQYPIGEPEDLLMVDGSLVLLCAEYFANSTDQKAAVCYLFKTGIGEVIQGNITEQQSFNYVSLIVNGNAATEFAPYRTFNTIEEACIIANYVHGATITVSNLTTGYAVLLDGKYAINGSGGTQHLSRLFARNVTVNLRTMQLDSTYLDNTELYAYVCTAGSIQALYSHIMLSDLTILTGSTFDYRYCDVSYKNKIVGASDLVGYVDSGSRSYNHVSIETHGDSTYLVNLLRSLAMRVAITVWFIGKTLGTAITLTNFGADSFEVNTGDATYPKLGYADGALYLVKTDGTHASLSAGDIVRLQG